MYYKEIQTMRANILKRIYIYCLYEMVAFEESHRFQPKAGLLIKRYLWIQTFNGSSVRKNSNYVQMYIIEYLYK